jgi:hypothetical protein
MGPVKHRSREKAACAFPGCVNPARAFGLCGTHRRHQITGQLRPIRALESSVTVEGSVATVDLLSRRGVKVGEALIDAEDVPLIRGFRWRKHGAYAGRGRCGILLHRVVMGAPPGMEVDHIGGTSTALDCRKRNLRLCTLAENRQNVVQPRAVGLPRNVSEVKGRFYVRASAAGRRYSAGRGFPSIAEAAVAARDLRNKLFTHANEERHK